MSGYEIAAIIVAIGVAFALFVMAVGFVALVTVAWVARHLGERFDDMVELGEQRPDDG